MDSFADRLYDSIKLSNSRLLAGFDPVIDAFPQIILADAGSRSSGSEEFIYNSILGFYGLGLEALAGHVAAVKPNLAFFEQYGLAGMRAFSSLVSMCKERGLPVIADGKRSDISSSAKAYSAAFLGHTTIAGKKHYAFNCDALTVNPFLGPESLSPFLEDCATEKKGIFVLVRTSNPEADTLQSAALPSGETVSSAVAGWIEENSGKLRGHCGLSGLGAVVGATRPDQSKELRTIMKSSFFLVPGVGAQGASFAQTASCFTAQGQAAVINVSRALFSGFASDKLDRAGILAEIQMRLRRFNTELNSVLPPC